MNSDALHRNPLLTSSKPQEDKTIHPKLRYVGGDDGCIK
jgi:hypothetical protein